MKAQRTLMILAIVLVPVTMMGAVTGELFLRAAEGDVLLKVEGSADWVPASMNTPLGQGDRIWASADGQGEVFVRDGSRIALSNNTLLDIVTIQDGVTEFGIATGDIKVTRTAPQGGVVVVYSPAVSLSAGPGSSFEVAVAEGGDTEVIVFSGEAALENDAVEKRLRAGESLLVRAGSGGGEAEEGPSLAYDERAWPGVNTQAQGYESSPYLPEELSAYSYDLNANGQWINTAEYGYAWVPRVASTYGWSPYRVGRWVWMANDYVWISYEPWGWAPYHYGRWAFVGGRGWCWVPPRRGSAYWGPGYVGWVHTPTHLAWVPLAPRETYYGHGYYGPYSVNITNFALNRVVMPREFKHIHVRNGVVTLDRDQFLGRKKGQTNFTGNLFMKNGVSAGPPKIKPERATTMPVLKEVKAVRLPPDRLPAFSTGNVKRIHPVLAGADRVKTPEAKTKPDVARSMPETPAKKVAVPAAVRAGSPKADPRAAAVPVAPEKTVRAQRPVEVPEASLKKPGALPGKKNVEPPAVLRPGRSTVDVQQPVQQPVQPRVRGPVDGTSPPQNGRKVVQQAAPARPETAVRRVPVQEPKVSPKATAQGARVEDRQETPRPAPPAAVNGRTQAGDRIQPSATPPGAAAAFR